MMKLNIKEIVKFGCYVVLMAACIGCNDFLTEDNPNAKPKKDYFTSLSESDKVLTATYSALLNHYNLNILEESWRSDLGYPSVSSGRPALSSAGESWYFKTYTNSQKEINKKWEALYIGIFRANQLIEGLEGPLGDQRENEFWILQMAEARLLRGIFHFWAYQTFNNGRVIIRDNVPVELEEFNIPVSSKEEVRAFILEDFEYAYENLPATWGSDAQDELSAGRMNKAIATMFLANFYFLEAPATVDGDGIEPDYEKALMYYQEIVNNYNFQLVGDPELMFTRAGEFNNEAIFEIIYDDNLRPELDRFDEQSPSNRMARYSAPGTMGGQRVMTPTAWLAYKYKTENIDPLDSRNTVTIIDLDSKEEIETLRTISLRSSASVALVNDLYTTYYRSGITPAVVPFGKYEFAYFKKYTNHDIVTTENNLPKGSWYSGKNITIHRLSEVYLNIAECYLQKGDVTSALKYINDVRAKWGLVLLGSSVQGEYADRTYDELVYSVDQLMDHLMFTEKPLELSVEGHSIRWIDLRRWGKISEAFKRASEQVFYGARFQFIDPATGNKVNRNKSELFEGSDPKGTSIDLIDCVDAANNYIPEVHDYYPLPLEEIISNPNLGQ
ncbi:RagB/SusD family nutrient uptake outer membrane protein [Flammeovirga agarivorans]|uniref:RagB/SusD family nutrient uptake outer membrane protein n=1 Tax=Flammeovirga agarivorans TaxID=2726742 RepID=A0A7X8SNJ2_9BACT|nr:RagB/SusD family nutrient uptake outer membrane protein [Flammeovirga agarivorans]NLR93494.1 RagB/SusD family nutrient uptake outer membrane protein [Flammeovirga agarivorans]